MAKRFNHKSLYLAIVSSLSLTVYSSPTENHQPVLYLNTINGQNGFKISGIQGAGIGEEVRAIGDINHDGIDDIFLASSWWNHEFSYVIFGEDQGLPHPFDLTTLNGSNGFTLSNTTFVSGVGDFNGDGKDDVLFSSTLIYGTDQPFPAHLDLTSITPAQGFEFTSQSHFIHPSNHFGVGDVNGDGFDDVAIGSPREYPTPIGCWDYYYYFFVDFNRGASYIVFGNNTTPTEISVDDIDGTNGIKIIGRSGSSQDGAEFGSLAKSIGDFNGDGLDDFLIQAQGEGCYRYDAEDVRSDVRSYVIFGGDQVANHMLSVDDLNGINGFAINSDYRYHSAMGDWNQDGFDDLASCNFAYCAFTLGTDQAMPASIDLDVNFDGTDGFSTNLHMSYKMQPVQFFYDHNHDGFIDSIRVIDPSPQSNPKDTYVFYGKPGGFSSFYDKDNFTPSQGQIIEHTESRSKAITVAGDVNSDGYTDLLLSLNNGESYVIYGTDLIFADDFELD